MKSLIRCFWLLILISAIGVGAWQLAINRRAEFTSKTTTIASVTPTPVVSAPTPMLDEYGTIVHDWETENPEAAKADWLNQGVWLKRGVTSSLSFSPDGRWIVGGLTQAFLWDARTGENKGTLGKSFYDNKFANFKSVSFISNQEIALLQNHKVTVFDLTLLPVAAPPTRLFYFSIGSCGPTSKEGIWTYSYDIYDPNLVKEPLKTERRLRFWDYKNAKFTRVLPSSLLEPVFTQDSKISIPVRIRDNKSWLAVMRKGYGIFVLDTHYKKVWQESLSHPLLPRKTGNKKTSFISDFALGSKNVLYLLDQNKGLRRVNLKTGKEYKAWPLPNSATSFEVSDDGKFWAFGNEEGRLILVDAETRQIIRNKELPFPTEIIKFSPDGSSIAVGGLVILPISNSTMPVKPN